MTKYDDASWHYGGDYPDDLPEEAAATHIGLFFAWVLLNGHGSSDFVEDAADELEQLRNRSTTPGEFLINVSDEKFVSDDLDNEGNAFTVAYYEGDDDDSRYIDDFLETFDTDLENLYRVPDTWESFDRFAPVIGRRYAEWVTDERPSYVR